ncbi:uncharacterized protein PG986_011512 [Apiospora aurea]|uniref:Uncharacterized protein n=1 Tax=Apiospora aurea TaxID=335848 RepID=A0ABR1PXP4_9PEZI
MIIQLRGTSGIHVHAYTQRPRDTKDIHGGPTGPVDDGEHTGGTSSVPGACAIICGDKMDIWTTWSRTTPDPRYFIIGVKHESVKRYARG